MICKDKNTGDTYLYHSWSYEGNILTKKSLPLEKRLTITKRTCVRCGKEIKTKIRNAPVA